jgi:hypothetical protein
VRRLELRESLESMPSWSVPSCCSCCACGTQVDQFEFQEPEDLATDACPDLSAAGGIDGAIVDAEAEEQAFEEVIVAASTRARESRCGRNAAPELSPIIEVSPDVEHGLKEVPLTPQSRLQRSISDGLRSASRKLSGKLSRTLSGQFKSVGAAATKPDFAGLWVCVDTWGLDAFLQALGFSKLRRIAASKAPWPTWEFEQDGDMFVFINRTAMGAIREEFAVGGPEYTQIDGQKQRVSSRAIWEEDKLVIERAGPQGRFREERHLDDSGRLHFTLQGLEEGTSVSWGRTFARKPRAAKEVDSAEPATK